MDVIKICRIVIACFLRIFLFTFLFTFLVSCVSIMADKTDELSAPEDVERVAVLAIEEQPPAVQPVSLPQPDPPEPPIPTKEIPSIVIFLETDIVGNPIGSRRVEEGIFQELSSAGYNLLDVDIQAEDVLPGNIQEIYALVQEQHEDYDVQRIFFGTARIIEVDESEGFNIRVRGSLGVYDVGENSITHVISNSVNSQASDSVRAIYSAFSRLGQDLGRLLIEDFP